MPLMLLMTMLPILTPGVIEKKKNNMNPNTDAPLTLSLEIPVAPMMTDRCAAYVTIPGLIFRLQEPSCIHWGVGRQDPKGGSGGDAQSRARGWGGGVDNRWGQETIGGEDYHREVNRKVQRIDGRDLIARE